MSNRIPCFLLIILLILSASNSYAKDGDDCDVEEEGQKCSCMPEFDMSTYNFDKVCACPRHCSCPLDAKKSGRQCNCSNHFYDYSFSGKSKKERRLIKLINSFKTDLKACYQINESLPNDNLMSIEPGKYPISDKCHIRLKISISAVGDFSIDPDLYGCDAISQSIPNNIRKAFNKCVRLVFDGVGFCPIAGGHLAIHRPDENYTIFYQHGSHAFYGYADTCDNHKDKAEELSLDCSYYELEYRYKSRDY